MRIHTSRGIIVCLSSRACASVYLTLNLPAQMEAARPDPSSSPPAAESTAAEGASAALPLQLSQMLGDAAPKVADFTELLSGVPWTKQLMEDLSYQLRNHGRFEVVLTTIPGFAKIVALLAHCTRKRTKEEQCELHAEVLCYRGVTYYPRGRPSVEDPCVAHFETFPDTPMGVKDAFEFLKSSVQYLSRRGFCDSCLQQERPKKRIRLQSCDVCGECLLKRALA